MVSGPTRTWPCSINLTAWGREAIEISIVVGRLSAQGDSTGKCCALQQQIDKQGSSTYPAHTFSHFESMHNHSEPSPAKSGHGEFVFDLGELGGGIEDPHVVEFRQ